jgi:hypothetical protein
VESIRSRDTDDIVSALTVKKRAAGKTLTLAELRQFIDGCKSHGVPGEARIGGHAGLRGVYEVSVSVPEGEQPPATASD